MPPVYRAGPEDLNDLVPLFDAYRQFYRRPSDPAGARRFLGERLAAGESVVLLARLAEGEPPVGFTQLYPTFSSVGMRRVWTLNDLFVAESARGHGVARALMEAARAFSAETGAAYLQLETERSNLPAQALYDGLGYTRDSEHYFYSLPTDPA